MKLRMMERKLQELKGDHVKAKQESRMLVRTNSGRFEVKTTTASAAARLKMASAAAAATTAATAGAYGHHHQSFSDRFKEMHDEGGYVTAKDSFTRRRLLQRRSAVATAATAATAPQPISRATSERSSSSSSSSVSRDSSVARSSASPVRSSSAGRQPFVKRFGLGGAFAVDLLKGGSSKTMRRNERHARSGVLRQAHRIETERRRQCAMDKSETQRLAKMTTGQQLQLMTTVQLRKSSFANATMPRGGVGTFSSKPTRQMSTKARRFQEWEEAEAARKAEVQERKRSHALERETQRMHAHVKEQHRKYSALTLDQRDEMVLIKKISIWACYMARFLFVFVSLAYLSICAHVVACGVHV